MKKITIGCISAFVLIFVFFAISLIVGLVYLSPLSRNNFITRYGGICENLGNFTANCRTFKDPGQTINVRIVNNVSETFYLGVSCKLISQKVPTNPIPNGSITIPFFNNEEEFLDIYQPTTGEIIFNNTVVFLNVQLCPIGNEWTMLTPYYQTNSVLTDNLGENNWNGVDQSTAYLGTLLIYIGIGVMALEILVVCVWLCGMTATETSFMI